jgi:hypothetical protein
VERRSQAPAMRMPAQMRRDGASQAALVREAGLGPIAVHELPHDLQNYYYVCRPDGDRVDAKRKPSALAFVSGSLARDRQGPSIAPSRAGRVRLLEFDCLSVVRSDRTDSMRVSMLGPTLASTHARYR